MHELNLCGPHIEQVKLNFLVVDTEPIDDASDQKRSAHKA
jgi:hypothetical protein